MDGCLTLHAKWKLALPAEHIVDGCGASLHEQVTQRIISGTRVCRQHGCRIVGQTVRPDRLPAGHNLGADAVRSELPRSLLPTWLQRRRQLRREPAQLPDSEDEQLQQPQQLQGPCSPLAPTPAQAAEGTAPVAANDEVERHASVPQLEQRQEVFPEQPRQEEDAWSDFQACVQRPQTHGIADAMASLLQRVANRPQRRPLAALQVESNAGEAGSTGTRPQRKRQMTTKLKEATQEGS
jgi:hypothetical protein